MNIRNKTYEIVILSILAVIIFVCKLALASLPNIETSAFFIIIFTCVLGKKMFYTIAVYVLLEVLIFGIGFWTIGYLVLWPLLVFITLLLRGKMRKSNLFRSVVSGLFGFCFDMFYALIIMAMSGFWAGVIYFVSGSVFSVMHMVGNYFIMMLLGNKMLGLISNAYKKINGEV